MGQEFVVLFDVGVDDYALLTDGAYQLGFHFQLFKVVISAVPSQIR